jgi:integrase
VKELRVFVHDDMKRIIMEHGNPASSLDEYIFPILVSSETDVWLQHKRRNRIKRDMNWKLSLIGKKLGFDVHLCLNLARHSFATTLKLSGTPVAFISDAMGHTSTNTTQHYLKSIPDENIQQMSNQLLSFA